MFFNEFIKNNVFILDFVKMTFMRKHLILHGLYLFTMLAAFIALFVARKIDADHQDLLIIISVGMACFYGGFICGAERTLQEVKGRNLSSDESFAILHLFLKKFTSKAL